MDTEIWRTLWLTICLGLVFRCAGFARISAFEDAALGFVLLSWGAFAYNLKIVMSAHQDGARAAGKAGALMTGAAVRESVTVAGRGERARVARTFAGGVLGREGRASAGQRTFQ